MSKTQRVTAIFNDRDNAIKAINRLSDMGYSKNNISLLVARNSWTNEKDVKIEENSKAPEGAITGATVGGAAGAIIAGLTATGAVALTGGAGLLAAGPIVAACAGAGVGGTTGGIVGSLIGLGIPEVEAKFVDEELGKGSVLVDVETHKDRTDDIESTFKDCKSKKVTVH